MFVKYVKKWSLYGSTLFQVKGYGDLDRKQILLAISWSGMHILDRITKQAIQAVIGQAPPICLELNRCLSGGLLATALSQCLVVLAFQLPPVSQR